jgi:signal peptidase I
MNFGRRFVKWAALHAVAAIVLSACGGGGGDEPSTGPVSGNNTAPTIGGTPAATARAGTAYSFTPSASDAEGDKLTFSITNQPSWLTFSSSTGAVSGTPASSDVGDTGNMTISVSDGRMSTSLAAFKIHVDAASGGSSPPPAAPPISGAPRVLYTDLTAGPTSGGENNLGAYVSIFGINFGGNANQVRVYFGDTEAAAYHYFGPSKGRSDIWQITVQPGNIGSGTLPIKVVVNGVNSNTDKTFLVNPGDILFVDNVSGNDSTAVKGDINRPWKTVQTSSQGGALGQAGPGDVIVLRGKTTYKDVGYEDHWIRFNNAKGSEPKGTAGTGYITVQAYPKEDVHYVPPAGTHGGIHGVSSGVSDWIVISGLHIESVATSASDGAPVNLQAGSDHWRVVNNELGPWPANDGAKAGGLVGNGNDIQALGNHIHGIDGGTLNHGVYLDTGASNVEIAYNEINDVNEGNLIQLFDNLGGGDITNITIHHNLLHDGGRYGLNMADGTVSAHVYNNVIYNTSFAGIRINQNGHAALSQVYEHNTLYSVCMDKSGGAIENTWQATSGSVKFQFNIVSEGGSAACNAGYSNSSSDNAVSLSRNEWVGYSAPNKDSNSIIASVLFVATSLFDFHLQPGSPAIDAAVGSSVIDDYAANPRSGTPDLGAYER